MADQKPFRHIKIEGYSQTDEFVSPRGGGKQPPIRVRERAIHGNKIREHLNNIKLEFEALKDVELPDGIIRDDAIYVEFISDFDFKPAFDSFHSDAKISKYELLNIKEEIIDGKVRFRVNVMLTEGGISHFLSRVNDYISSETETPKHNRLISNLESIQIATLKAFWTEPNENPFPNEDEVVWWEVWFRKKIGIDHTSEYGKIIFQLGLVNAEIADQELVFPEHYIKLVKASPRQLSESIYLLDNLAELRKPKETADFFTTFNILEKEDAFNELQSRIENQTNEDSLAI